MLHRLALTTLSKIISTGSLYAFHCFQLEPFKSTSNSLKVSVTQSKKKQLAWRVLTFTQVAYLIFICIRLYESLAIKGTPLEKCTVHVALAAAYVFYSTSSINSWRKKDQIAEFLTNFFHLDGQFVPLKHQSQATKKFGKLIRTLYYLCVSAGALHFPLFLALSQNPNFIFSILSPLLKDNLVLHAITKYFCGFVELWLGLANWTAGGIVHSITFCVVANSLPLWADVMKYDTSSREIPMKRQTYYRIIQLLMIQFNDCYAYDSFLAITTVAYFGMIICSFATLRYYGKIHFLAYAIFPTVAVIVILYIVLLFPNAGRAADSHARMVKQWGYIESQPKKETRDGNDGGNKWRKVRGNLRKQNLAFIRSCHQVGFQVGPLFAVKTGTTLTYGDMVLDQLINCLISF